jgi:hypothetical protein
MVVLKIEPRPRRIVVERNRLVNRPFDIEDLRKRPPASAVLLKIVLAVTAIWTLVGTITVTGRMGVTQMEHLPDGYLERGECRCRSALCESCCASPPGSRPVLGGLRRSSSRAVRRDQSEFPAMARVQKARGVSLAG